MAKSNATPVVPQLNEALIRRVEKLPAALSIKDIAAEFKRPVATVHKQIKRGVFPLRVQDSGAEKFVALADYVRFLVDGEIQTQPVAKRPVGRPTNASKVAAAREKAGVA